MAEIVASEMAQCRIPRFPIMVDPERHGFHLVHLPVADSNCRTQSLDHPLRSVSTGPWHRRTKARLSHITIPVQCIGLADTYESQEKKACGKGRIAGDAAS